ncbi:MAG: MarR family transcriptional regulator [Candidatus Dormiibacterota bacterium]
MRRPVTEAVASDGSAARLRLAVTRLAKRLRPTAAAGALTPTEVDVLFAADRRGPLRLSDLAGFAGLNPTMLSRLVPRLEAGGLMRRLVVEGDRRVCRVDVTPKGRRLLDRIRSERNDALSQLLRGLDDLERRAVLDALPVIEELAERLLARSPAMAGSSRG